MCYNERNAHTLRTQGALKRSHCLITIPQKVNASGDSEHAMVITQMYQSDDCA